MRRLESLEDRRLLAASISIDATSVALYEGDAVAAENVTVTQIGTTYRFVSNNPIDVGTNVPGLTITHPGGDPTIVDVDGIAGLNIVMNSAGSRAEVQAAAVPTSVFDTVPEATYTFDDAATVSALLISSGGAPPLAGDVYTLRISPQGAAPGAPALYLANKTSLVINQDAAVGGYSSIAFYYASLAPVAGLASVTVNQSAGSDVAVLMDMPPTAVYVINQGGGDDSAWVSIDGTAGTLATILDGGPGTDMLLIDAGGRALSAANFYASPGGSVSIRGPVLPGGEVAYSSCESIVVDGAGAGDPPIIATRPVNAVQNVPLVDVLVGVFRVASPTARATDFGATIDWGEFETSAGKIVQDASDPTLFRVYGGYTYAYPESFRPMRLVVRRLPTSTTINLGGSPVTINTPAATNSGDGSATILVTRLSALAVSVQGARVHGIEGRALEDVLVATFTSSATAAAADFAATVAWGDGRTSSGRIEQDVSNPSLYRVYGSHTYHAPGRALTTAITVRPVASSFQALVDGSPVTFYRSEGRPITETSQAFIDDAPIDVTVNPFNGHENIAIASGVVIVATFTDLGLINPSIADPAAYTATIYWGDGSSGVGAVAIERLGTPARFVVKGAPHTYTTPGSYPVTVVVAQPGQPALGIGSNTATIADAPLNRTPTQPAIPDATESVRIANAVIATFVDANPLATTDQFQVTVDWGDGSGLQAARVIQPGGVGTPFRVIASHTYADSIPPGGGHALIVSVRDTFGSAVNLYNTITVLARPLTVEGAMDPASDTGASASDGITNDVSPTFTGRTGGGGVTVYVFASKDGGPTTAIGSTTSDDSGAWSFTPSYDLADGVYLIQARAYDAGGRAVSELATLASGLVIDTVGPKVADVRFDNTRGRVVVTYSDAGAGLATATARDPDNYRFLRQAQPARRGTTDSIAVEPGETPGEPVVALVINGGRGIRGGRFALQLLSLAPSNPAGVQDVAGNALDGENHGRFPSGDGVNGGDFAAYLDATRRSIQPSRGQAGRATPVSPPGRPATGRFILRGGNPLPSAGSAVRMTMARQPLTAARAARLAR